MRKDDICIESAGLQFFGTVSASVSHEIKNVLAIINENAGLLEDLVILAERGRPLDLQRLKKLAGSVSEQIRRADRIVKNMNRFAHSVDESEQRVDANEILELLVALSGRPAAMRRITLDINRSADPMMLTTSPFFLLHLLWRCLDFAMDAVGDGRVVQLACEKTATSVRIRFKDLRKLQRAALDSFPAEREKNMLSRLHAELAVDPGLNEIMLELPA
jgi:C4-dicarboxylate-specific signal transduction histidine kinase